MKPTFKNRISYDRIEKMAAELKLTDPEAICEAIKYAEMNRSDSLCWSLLFTASDNVIMKDKEQNRARKARFIILKFSPETRDAFCSYAKYTNQIQLLCRECDEILGK